MTTDLSERLLSLLLLAALCRSRLRSLEFERTHKGHDERSMRKTRSHKNLISCAEDTMK